MVDVRRLGAALATTKTSALFKTEHVEVVRLVVAAGKEIAEHEVPGEITVQCVEGKIAFTAMGKTTELSAGEMLYLNAGEPHSLECTEDGSLLVTILLEP